MTQDILKNYLRDLIYLLKEYSNEQKTDDDFSKGIKFGYSQVVDLIQSQADAFGINLDNIGFYDYEKFKNKK
jgi:hypothetical protein